MLRLSRNRFRHLWAVKLYLVTVIIATIAIMIVDISLLQSHRAARQELSESNLRLEGERLAIELERHLWQLAEEGLRNEAIRHLSAEVIAAPDAEAVRQAWAKLHSYKSAYPWVDRFFILHGNELLPGPTQLPKADGKKARGRHDFGDLVRTMESALTFKSLPEIDRISPLALNTSEGPKQFYYTQLPLAHAVRTVLGFVLDLHWVENQLLDQCRREIRMPDKFLASIAPRTAPSSRESAREIRAQFRTVLPFWELALPVSTLAAGKAATSLDITFAGLSMLILVFVCAMGILLLLRLNPELKVVQLRSDFVSGISHELKTPLTMIRLYGETLSEESGLSPEERRTASQVITRESERLSHLIGNLLDLSKIERGQESYRWVSGDLAPVISETVDVYGRWLVQRGFLLTKDISSNLPPVRFDPEKITQIIFNLMDNSRKYCNSTKAIWVGLWRENGKVIFELQDKGIGIPRKDQKKIFQQFFRAANSQNQGGCGIGLYLVDCIMRAHGGKVEVDSEEGVGSRFRLIFPTLEPAADLVAEAMPHPLAHRMQ